MLELGDELPSSSCGVTIIKRPLLGSCSMPIASKSFLFSGPLSNVPCIVSLGFEVLLICSLVVLPVGLEVTQWMVITLIVTSMVQHVKQTTPRSRPFMMVNARMLADDTSKHTTDAISVRRATSCNRVCFQSLCTLLLTFIKGLIKRIVIYKLKTYIQGTRLVKVERWRLIQVLRTKS